jgi:ubiquinol-cytochrome c reductase cytochrome c1 subunit
VLGRGPAARWRPAPARHRLGQGAQPTNDLPALQNGAKLFVNYCLNCHSAAFMRYNRLQDIGLSEQQIKDNLLFATDKVGDTMKVGHRPEAGQGMVRRQPARPDADRALARRPRRHRRRLPVHLPAHLLPRPTKATGWNNLAFPNVGMPHVLWELQGEREPVFEKIEARPRVQVFKGWKQVSPGTMTPLQYDQAVGDLVGYLQWMAEPAQNHRVRVGVWVLLFLLVFTVIAWRLNAAFWKDVR